MKNASLERFWLVLSQENKMKRIGKISKKGQHEIVGFILIVVIVVVIGLFLLVFYLRQEPVERQSSDIQNFLQSSMRYTTSCAINYAPEYSSIEDLIKSCYKNENQECVDERKVCEAVNETLSELVPESLQVDPEGKINAYSMFIYYEDISEADEENGSKEEIQKQEILRLSEGNCTGSKTGAEHLIAYHPGSIVASIEICYI